MVHPADMTNPVGVAATEFTAGGRHFPTPHPPKTGRGGVCSIRGPQPCMARRDFLLRWAVGSLRLGWWPGWLIAVISLANGWSV